APPPVPSPSPARHAQSSSSALRTLFRKNRAGHPPPPAPADTDGRSSTRPIDPGRRPVLASRCVPKSPPPRPESASHQSGHPSLEPVRDVLHVHTPRDPVILWRSATHVRAGL